jgi:non-homologous end joining protein Ku
MMTQPPTATRSLKKGVTMSLGLFTFQVNVFGALEGTKQVELNNLCSKEHGPTQTRQTLACPVCGNDDRTTFVKGKDMGGGHFALADQDFLDSLGVSEGVKSIIEMNPHPRETMASTFSGEKNYVLTPSTTGSETGYALAVAMIKARPELAFVTTWAPRTSPAMFSIDAIDDVLVLREVAWPGAVRALPEVGTTYDPKQLTMALSLVDAMVTDFDAELYIDDKTSKILEFLDTAATVAGIVPTDKGDETPEAVPHGLDVTDALAAAVAAAQNERPPAQPLPEKVPANVKVITKKAPGKKSTRKSA